MITTELVVCNSDFDVVLYFSNNWIAEIMFIDWLANNLVSFYIWLCILLTFFGYGRTRRTTNVFTFKGGFLIVDLIIAFLELKCWLSCIEQFVLLFKFNLLLTQNRLCVRKKKFEYLWAVHLLLNDCWSLSTILCKWFGDREIARLLKEYARARRFTNLSSLKAANWF